MNIHRLTTTLLAVGLSLGFASQPLRAGTTGTYNGLNYSDNGTSITITGYTTAVTGTLVIPSTILVGSRYDPVTSIGNSAFQNCSRVTDVTIPDSVTSIGTYAFYSCTKMTSVTIGYGVTSIGDSAFTSCANLTSVTIGSGVTSIGESAFYICSRLASVTIPDSVTSIGTSAFSNCTKMTSVTIGSGVTSIGTNVFESCTSLSSVTIPDSVTSIGTSAFQNCTSMKSVTLPASLTSIGASAFSSCTSLNSTTLPDSLTSIGSGAFYACTKMTSVTIGSGVTSIADHAFSICKGLTSVTIPSGVTSIKMQTFADCTSLTSVTLPASLTSIESGAFSGCTSLTSVTLPASLTTMKSQAFNYCTSLTAATFLGNAPTMGAEVFDRAGPGFTVYHAIGKSDLTVPTWKGYPSLGTGTSGGIIYTDNGSVVNLTGMDPATIGKVTLPGKLNSHPVIRIGASAFANVSGITGVTIPASITGIGDGAFSGCGALLTATFSGNAPSMGSGVFTGAASGFTVYYTIGKTGFTSPTWHGYLASGTGTSGPIGYTDNGLIVTITACKPTATGVVTIPKVLHGHPVTGIAATVFANVTGITAVTIPASVTSIGDGAFSGCSALLTATFQGNAPTAMGSGVFTGAASGFTVYFIEGKTGFSVPTWKGYAAVMLAPIIVVQQPANSDIADGGAKDYGSVLLGSNKSLTFTIKNTGTANMTGIAITKNGTNAAAFSVTSAPAVTVAPGASTTFVLKFTPNSIGTKTAGLQIASNVSGSTNPFDISVSGICTAAAAPASSSSMDLASGLLASTSSTRPADTSKTVITVDPTNGLKYLTLVVTKPPGTADQLRIVEVSSNLMDWYSGRNHTAVLRNDATILRVRDNTPLTPGTKRYIRLRNPVQ